MVAKGIKGRLEVKLTLGKLSKQLIWVYGEKWLRI